VTGVAGHSVGVVRRHNLREGLGLGGAGSVAARAEHGGIGEDGLYG